MGTELVPETSGDLRVLTWPSALENFSEFCRCVSFKSYVDFVVLSTLSFSNHQDLWLEASEIFRNI